MNWVRGLSGSRLRGPRAGRHHQLRPAIKGGGKTYHRGVDALDIAPRRRPSSTLWETCLTPAISLTEMTWTTDYLTGRNRANYGPSGLMTALQNTERSALRPANHPPQSSAELDFAQNLKKAMDAIALARQHLWLALEGFSLSAADPDIQELPVALHHPLADPLGHAA